MFWLQRARCRIPCPLRLPPSFICTAGPRAQCTCSHSGEARITGLMTRCQPGLWVEDDGLVASHGMPELPQVSSRLAFLDLVNPFSDFIVSHRKSETTEAIPCKKKKKKFRDPASGSQPFPWAFFLFATVTSVQWSIAYRGWRVHG